VNVTARETLASADVVTLTADATSLTNDWLAFVKIIMKKHLILLLEAFATVETFVFHFHS